jgi:hypothetical protein
MTISRFGHGFEAFGMDTSVSAIFIAVGVR